MGESTPSSVLGVRRPCSLVCGLWEAACAPRDPPRPLLWSPPPKPRPPSPPKLPLWLPWPPPCPPPPCPPPPPRAIDSVAEPTATIAPKASTAKAVTDFLMISLLNLVASATKNGGKPDMGAAVRSFNYTMVSVDLVLWRNCYCHGLSIRNERDRGFSNLGTPS